MSLHLELQPLVGNSGVSSDAIDFASLTPGDVVSFWTRSGSSHSFELARVEEGAAHGVFWRSQKDLPREAVVLGPSQPPGEGHSVARLGVGDRVVLYVNETETGASPGCRIIVTTPVTEIRIGRRPDAA